MIKNIVKKQSWLYYQLISLPLNKQKRVDLHLSRFAKSLPCGVFLDIGSNVGKIGHLIKGKCRYVIGVEPLMHLYNYCVESGVYSKMFNSALGSEIDNMLLRVPIKNGVPVYTRASLESIEGNEFLEVDVKVETADYLFNEFKADIRFIKIDVEGHELGVLQGFSMLKDLFDVHIVIELELRHGLNCINAVGLLMDYGFQYRGFFSSKGKVEADGMDVLTFLNDPYWNNEYVNNFFFYK